MTCSMFKYSQTEDIWGTIKIKHEHVETGWCWTRHNVAVHLPQINWTINTSLPVSPSMLLSIFRLGIYTGDPLHSRAACTQPCNVNTHRRAHCSPGARLCGQWGHGCVNNGARLCASARLCGGPPVFSYQSGCGCGLSQWDTTLQITSYLIGSTHSQNDLPKFSLEGQGYTMISRWTYQAKWIINIHGKLHLG